MTPPSGHPSKRDTISIEDAAVLSQQAFAGAQHLLRLNAPQVAADARPGMFVHLRCDPSLPMRRPMSIMRAHPQQGWIDLLYKVHGPGTRMLAARKPGDRLNVIGPIGVPFLLHPDRRPLLLGGGVGIPPMVFLAETMKRHVKTMRPLAILGSEIPFPFKPQPSRIMVEGFPPEAIAAMPLLEDWGIPCRLTSRNGIPGCFDGWITDLAQCWLSTLSPGHLHEVEIHACGPVPMLKAVAQLAQQFDIPCQVSVEEFMACAVGGCAGCAIAVHSADGIAMKRVCVDGPVFDARAIYPQPGNHTVEPGSTG